MLKVLAETFSYEKFEVLTAKDGEEGLRVALAERPDVILLDILLPRMDGMTMLRKLREDAWGKRTPVMVLSNLSDASRVLEAMQSGVYDFLVKSDWKLQDVVWKVKKKLKLA